ncbi:CU044_5270 family protein [Actinoplanes sp. G11-F43]|uniref:CU044_5270 family protein n=1 Tax=Actinoplanes sp. G11-F43 TaxID=3424130 RepID=UPI003D32F852
MSARQHEPDDMIRADLQRLLPPAGAPELTPERHRDLKRNLITGISARPPARRWRIALVTAAAMAVVLLGGAAVAIRPWQSGTETRQSYVAPIIVPVQRASVDGVEVLLKRVATAAEEKPPAGDSGFVYVKSRVGFLTFPENGPAQQEAGVDPRVMEALHDREIWIPLRSGDGLIRERGLDIVLSDPEPHRRLTELPADPDVLLEHAYTATREDTNVPRDRAAFDYIGDAVDESALPPALTGALFRAAAKIPGVAMVENSVDALGRPGVAVAMTYLDERTEWIFDPATFEYLGQRSYLVADTLDGRAGTLTGTSAVVERAVVDKAGNRPR